MDAKTLLAGGFAVFGVGLAVYVGLGTGGGERAAPPAERVRVVDTVDSAGNVVEPVYERTRGERAAEVVGTIATTGAAMAKAAGLLGGGDEAGFAESVALSIGGLVRGDHDAFVAAMRALGGVLPGEVDGEHPLFAQLSEKLEGAEVDLSRLEVSAHEVPGRGARAMRGERDGPPVNRQVSELRPGRLFPEATAAVDEKAVDVRFPFRARGSKQEEWFGVVLVWNGDVKRWQPGGFQVIRVTVEVRP